MSVASTTASSAAWAPAIRRRPLRLSAETAEFGDPLSMLALRFVAHLPYFKVAGMLVLPQGLSTAGVVIMTLLYALACLCASRSVAWLRGRVELHNAATLPLLGTTGVLIAMLASAPLVALLLPRHPELLGATPLLPACLALLAPACAVFFAAQLLTGYVVERSRQ